MKIPISFKKNKIEMKIYDYIKAQFNYSSYIKNLVLKDMQEKGIELEISNKPIIISTINAPTRIGSNNIDF